MNRIIKFFIPIIILLIFLTNTQAVCAQNSTMEKFSTNAESAILMEKNSTRILFEKNSNKPLPMASCTKILTAITAIENSDINDMVIIPQEATNIEGSSLYLKTGEKLTILELLYGLILRSGNDCAVAIAIHVGGSVENFLNLMNATAIKIGARNSNFETPHGLDSEQHYTTAYDLGLISCYALNNDTFSDIVKSKSAKIGSNERDNLRIIYNKNKLLNNLENANGIKTGYTKKAGRCFVGSATKDNMQLISVVLNCGPMFEDAKKMLKFGFDNYRLETIVPYNKIFKSKNKGIYYISKNRFQIPLNKDGSENALIDLKIEENDMENPQIKISFANKLLFSEKLSIIKR